MEDKERFKGVAWKGRTGKASDLIEAFQWLLALLKHYSVEESDKEVRIHFYIEK